MSVSEILLFFMLMVCGLIFLMIQWVKRMPSAYAWDPNSHDKMANYSLDLLESTEPKSLFGWVLSQGKKAKYDPKEYIQDQIRRGSIDEDMNSYAIVETKTTEGANGSYHFYNPINGKGLDDSDFVTYVASKLTRCEVPMPSALERATSMDETIDRGKFSPDDMQEIYLFNRNGETAIADRSVSWHFDNEMRNYTIVDGTRYFLRGYHHLGFYAIGRSVHLLQDMAVPAHVRNDSHSGMAGDLKDPLEQFSDQADGNTKDWTFDPDRYYISVGHSIFSDAQNIWANHRSGYHRQTAGLFKSLAMWTYKNFYSINTIPGNFDSHNPENPNEIPFFSPRDNEKCHVAVFQFARLFRKMGDFFKNIMDGIPAVCFSSIHSDIVAHLQTIQGCRTVGDSCIIHIDCGEVYNFQRQQACYDCVITNIQSISKSFAAISNEVHSIVSELDNYMGGRIPVEAQDRRKREAFSTQGSHIMTLCRNFINEYQRLNVDGFVNAAAGGSNDSVAVLQKWIDSFPTQRHLTDVFAAIEDRGHVYNDKPNAPYCLDYNLIDYQRSTVQPQAIAFGAYLMANWFEWQYNPQRNTSSHLGVGLWLNENAKEGEDPILRSVQKIDVNSSAPVKAKDTVTLGVANHLPCHMDMAVEIEVIDEDDFIKENGLEIEFNWGRLSPDWSQVDDGEYIIATGSEPPKKKVWTAEPVKEEAGNVVRDTITKVVLSGSEGRKQVKIVLEQTEPYNLGLLKNFHVPKRGMKGGGISRTEENGDILKYNLNPTPGEPQGRDEINTSLLRMDFSTPVPTEPGN